jgi:RNA polymerase sigma factor (sigma-70 family)
MEETINNPFSESQTSGDSDLRLISESLQGDVDALELLIRRHQAWIYNIALRMVYDPDQAKDVTQEILLKVVTKLSTYNTEKASFRTWVYRIVANHVISMKRRKFERTNAKFEDYYLKDDYSFNEQLLDERSGSNPDSKILIEELKISCYLGSLLCLNRKERLVFIMGAILSIKDSVGYEIVGTTRTNFRKILSRGRKKISNFMNHTCGLLNKNNPCHCSNKLKGAIDAGWLNPEKLVFYRGETKKVKEIVYKKVNDSHIAYYQDCIDFYRNQPFYQPHDFSKNVRKIIESDEFKKVFRLH